jgi:uncharacterized membrane protein YccC
MNAAIVVGVTLLLVGVWLGVIYVWPDVTQRFRDWSLEQQIRAYRSDLRRMLDARAPANEITTVIWMLNHLKSKRTPAARERARTS